MVVTAPSRGVRSVGQPGGVRESGNKASKCASEQASGMRQMSLYDEVDEVVVYGGVVCGKARGCENGRDGRGRRG